MAIHDDVIADRRKITGTRRGASVARIFRLVLSVPLSYTPRDLHRAVFFWRPRERSMPQDVKDCVTKVKCQAA
jgi:hypothetical protein